MNPTSQPKVPRDGWIDVSTHIYDDRTGSLVRGTKIGARDEKTGKVVEVEQELFSGLVPIDPEWWYVIVSWRLVSGSAVPVGIEVRSNLDAGSRGTWDDAKGVAKAVTRSMVDRIPFGEVLDDGRRQVAGIWDARTARLRSERTAAVAKAIANRTGRKLPSMWKYELTAEIYNDLLGKSTTIAKDVHTALLATGRFPPELDEVRVRKWISKCARLGLIPELSKTSKIN